MRTQVAALFYSLIESAKLIGLNPATYLREPEAKHRALETAGALTLPNDLLKR